MASDDRTCEAADTNGHLMWSLPPLSAVEGWVLPVKEKGVSWRVLTSKFPLLLEDAKADPDLHFFNTSVFSALHFFNRPN